MRHSFSTAVAQLATGMRVCPVPGWVPGNSSPNGEANLFAQWYLNAMVSYMRWSVAQVSTLYSGLCGRKLEPGITVIDLRDECSRRNILANIHANIDARLHAYPYAYAHRCQCTKMPFHHRCLTSDLKSAYN